MIKIENRQIGDGAPSFVIAEVGVNHNGDLDVAKNMVDAIAAAGADCVKFQTFDAEEFNNSANETYTYISQGKSVTESMLAMFKRLELEKEDFARLYDHARGLGLIPLSTPTDRVAVDLLDDLGTGAFKIGSDDIVYTPFLDYVARKGKPVIISTGMAAIDDIDRAVATIRDAGNDQIIILHCVSLYPTPDESVNLRRMQQIMGRYGCPVGFSDHSSGVTAAAGAVAMGACIVEKHFTLDKNMPGPDHHFSMNPAELAQMTSTIRQLERCLGSGNLDPTQEELDMRDISRRSIVVVRDLPQGHTIDTSDLAYRRPGTGLLPFETPNLVGRRLKRALPARTLISMDDLAT